MKRLTKLGLVAALMIGAVGCSSGSSGSSDDKPKKDGDGPATTVADQKKDGEATPPPETGQFDRTTVEGEGVIKSTDMKSCDTEPGPVKASGTVTLPADKGPGTVSISVSWVNDETGTAFARSRVEIEGVDASGTKDWSVDNILPDNGVKVRCVVGAVLVD